MNLTELVRKVRDAAKAEGVKLNKKTSDFAIRTALTKIEEGLRSDGFVRLGTWGRWKLRDSNSKHYDIVKKQVIDNVKTTKVVQFKCGKALKRAVQPRSE